MNAWTFLTTLNTVCHFTSRERTPQQATNSELKRWCQNKAVEIDGRRVGWDEEILFPISRVVLFPKSKTKVTLW